MLRIRLECSPKNEQELKKILEEVGFTIHNEANLILTEKSIKSKFIFGTIDNEIKLIHPGDVIYIESLNNEIVIHTLENQYIGRHKLYEYEGVYESDGFLRVHKSFVININKINSIKSTFNSKFLLEMCNKDKVEVSRSYYHKFKEEIGF